MTLFALLFMNAILQGPFISLIFIFYLYQVSNPLSAICNNDDYNRSTRLLAATTLRNILGTRNLSEILSDREAIAESIHHLLVTYYDAR